MRVLYHIWGIDSEVKGIFLLTRLLVQKGLEEIWLQCSYTLVYKVFVDHFAVGLLFVHVCVLISLKTVAYRTRCR